MTLFLEQTLNGVQFGIMIFLLAAGLTLIFGIMGILNLAHGSLYMIGAYAAATAAAHGTPFLAAILVGAVAAAVTGIAIETLVVRRLYGREHLDQVLATFALILIANDGVAMIWGKTPLELTLPPFLAHSVLLGPLTYPAYRIALVAAGLALGVALWALVNRTRLGMRIRAGATNRELIGALGVNIALLNTVVFGIGALLAGVAGALLAPIVSVQVGMGEQVLILAFVAIVIGGLGSVRGAFAGALLVGLVDTLGRSYLPGLLAATLPADIADGLGGSLAAMSVYVLMAAVLIWKPRGLFGTDAR